MQATSFEFRHRFLILVGVFVAGFGGYRCDSLSAAEAFGGVLTPVLGRNGTGVVLWFGTALTLAAALIRTWSSAYLGADVVGDSVVRSETLVANGPYRYVRNPLYLGLILFAAGFGVTASRVGWFVIVFGSFVFLYRLLRWEESELSANQGESYRTFLIRVPRLLPALTRRLPFGDQKPRWLPALAGEILMWGFAVAMVALAIAREADLFRWLVAGSFVVYFVVRIARRALARAQPKKA